MKRVTILERSYTTRKKGGWFATENDADVLFDLTDIKLAKYLEKVNKNYRTKIYKNTIKNVLDEFNCSVEMTIDWTSECEDRSIEFTQPEQQREN